MSFKSLKTWHYAFVKLISKYSNSLQNVIQNECTKLFTLPTKV